MKTMRLAAVMVIGLAMTVGSAWANNMRVTNVTVVARDATTADVKFDISWDNSWRYTNINHDAAWVFFKVQKLGSTIWTNVTLEGSGANPPNYSIGTGTPIELLVDTDRVGMFVRRSASAEGSGPVSVTNVKAVWNIASNGLAVTDKVKMQALAVEMVYVAQGSFYVGSGGTEDGSFTAGDESKTWTNVVSPSVPFQITSEYPSGLGISNAVGCLWGTTNGGLSTIGTAGVLPAAFPKGYNAFYCMKYEITQGQYTDFLNLLTSAQSANRWASYSTYRYTIGTNTVGVFTNARPDRACNRLSWADGCAFADWAGLRPMTELEFEKACRGPLTPVVNEYAWGANTCMADASRALSGAEDGTETVTSSTSLGGCNYNNKAHTGGDAGTGPLRAGIFATASSSRQAAGASYWGIMELSGNIYEQCVTVGEATKGRLFTAVNGDGCLDATGYANVSTWPGYLLTTSAVGAGSRGGNWLYALVYARVSDRYQAAFSEFNRMQHNGFRAVRGAPSGVGP